MTPLTLSLAPGAHTVVVRSGRDERVVPLTIAAGADVTHNFEMKAAEPVALLGRVSVATDPPGARVAVDGTPRGTSPLTVADLTAEEHKVTVTSEAGSAERTVMVTAGGTASVVFSLTKVVGSGRRDGSRFPRRSTSRSSRTMRSSARAARVESCSRPAATTSRSRTAALGFQETLAESRWRPGRRPRFASRLRRCRSA